MRALAAHCPSVAESAALWGQSGLAVLSAYLKQGNETALREAAAAALDAILRLHKIQAVKEVLAKGMRIRGLLDKYGEPLLFPDAVVACTGHLSAMYYLYPVLLAGFRLLPVTTL